MSSRVPRRFLAPTPWFQRTPFAARVTPEQRSSRDPDEHRPPSNRPQALHGRPSATEVSAGHRRRIGRRLDLDAWRRVRRPADPARDSAGSSRRTLISPCRGGCRAPKAWWGADDPEHRSSLHHEVLRLILPAAPRQPGRRSTEILLRGERPRVLAGGGVLAPRASAGALKIPLMACPWRGSEGRRRRRTAALAASERRSSARVLALLLARSSLRPRPTASCHRDARALRNRRRRQNISRSWRPLKRWPEIICRRPQDVTGECRAGANGGGTEPGPEAFGRIATASGVDPGGLRRAVRPRVDNLNDVIIATSRTCSTPDSTARHPPMAYRPRLRESKRGG